MEPITALELSILIEALVVATVAKLGLAPTTENRLVVVHALMAAAARESVPLRMKCAQFTDEAHAVFHEALDDFRDRLRDQPSAPAVVDIPA